MKKQWSLVPILRSNLVFWRPRVPPDPSDASLKTRGLRILELHALDFEELIETVFAVFAADA